MGGEVCVGIRERDGGETVMLRWTNNLPCWLFDPDFYRTKRIRQKYIDMIKDNVGNDRPRFIKEVVPSPYGVVLIDVPSKSIFSRQGYCGIGRFSMLVGPNFVSDGDEALSLQRWIDRGELIAILRSETDEPLESAVEADFLKETEKLAKQCKAKRWRSREYSKRFGHLIISYKPKGWTFDDRDRCFQLRPETWAEVENWLKEKGWKTPPRFTGNSDQLGT